MSERTADEVLTQVFDSATNTLKSSIVGPLGEAAPVLVADKGVMSADAQGINAQAGLRLVGWAITESTGSATASLVLRHGTTTGGTRLTPTINLAAGEAGSDDMPEGGLACPNGVFVDIGSGSVDVILYYKVVA